MGSAFGLPGLDGSGLAGVLKHSRESGIKTVLDVTCSPDKNSMEILKPALGYTNIFIPSYNEARGLTGKQSLEEMAGELLKHGVQIVVIKMGKEGCYIQTGNDKMTIPAFKVDAVDTTGAGDSFVAGFIAVYLRGLSLYDCGRFANAAGAMCVREVGATTGIRSMKEIESFRRERNEDAISNNERNINSGKA